MTETIQVWGGRPLLGTVTVPKAKNSVLPLLAACLLCESTVALRQVPRLTDVECSMAILRAMGYGAQWCGRQLVVRPGQLTAAQLPVGPVGRMRAGVLFAAPVLARTGRCITTLPGGCKLGPRPIDLHLEGLAAMGAKIAQEGSRLQLRAPGGLRGVDHTLRFPSVGATETLLLAAATAHGTTVLRGAACEPEIADLAGFLNACGAKIIGAGEPVVVIHGVPQLMGAVYTPIPDRIVAATLACAVASAGGQATLRECDPFAFAPTLGALRQAGCTVEVEKNGVTVARQGRLRGIGRVFTGVYPGLATDAAPLVAAALLGAAGPSSIEDTVFPQRFGCAEGFAAMGAAVQVEGRTLHIAPAGTLHGAEVAATDLRGGAALLVAALAAQGCTRVRSAGYIARGYENLPGLLRQLGARVG